MALILSGLAAREHLKKALIERLARLKESRGSFALAIVQAGDRPDSASYIAAKKRFAAEIGVEVRHVHFSEAVSQAEIAAEIERLNADPSVAGAIVQLPLPGHLDARAVIDAVDPKKDADAIGSANVKRWSAVNTVEGHRPWPATAYGVYQLLDFYKIPVSGRKVCVIGRSELVGAPIAAILRAAGGIVTVCHSKTADLAKETLAADVIVSAVGRPHLLTAGHVRSGQAVIDVGISRVDAPDRPAGKLVGDADFAAVSAAVGGAGAITPVPGGVGPMTVLALFENLADCAIIGAY